MKNSRPYEGKIEFDNVVFDGKIFESILKGVMTFSNNNTFKGKIHYKDDIKYKGTFTFQNKDTMKGDFDSLFKPTNDDLDDYEYIINGFKYNFFKINEKNEFTVLPKQLEYRRNELEKKENIDYEFLKKITSEII